MKIAFVFLILQFFCTYSHAKNILISDIDDTLKISDVRNLWGLLSNGPKTNPNTVVPGIVPALYSIVERESIQSLFYVTKIPRSLSRLHRRFLFRNNFPPGRLVTRHVARDFKFAAIVKIILRERPKRVILLGDNGERDPQIYQEVQRFFDKSGIRFDIRIRTAYLQNAQLTPGQINFFRGEDLLDSFTLKLPLLNKQEKNTMAKLCTKVFKNR